MGPIGSDRCQFVRAGSPQSGLFQSLGLWLPKQCLVRRSGGWAIRGRSVAHYLRQYFSSSGDVIVDRSVRFQGEFAALPLHGGLHCRKPAGTAFAVAPGLVVTAGHCLREVHDRALYGLKELCLVFAYGKRAQRCRYLPAAQVVSGEEIQVEAGSFDPGDIRVPDVAVLRLPGGPASRCTVSVGAAFEGQSVYMLGHRHGLPATKSPGRITSVMRHRYPFVFAELSMFEGQSGAPVFDRSTHQLLGWAVGGLPHVGYGLAHATRSNKLKVVPLAQPPIQQEGYPYTQREGAGVRVMVFDRCLGAGFGRAK